MHIQEVLVVYINFNEESGFSDLCGRAPAKTNPCAGPTLDAVRGLRSLQPVYTGTPDWAMFCYFYLFSLSVGLW